MKDNKGIIIFLIIILFIGLSVYLSSRENKEEEVELMSGIHNVVISVEDYGDIYVELDADTAPITVTNFINLANSGFYDGLDFSSYNRWIHDSGRRSCGRWNWWIFRKLLKENFL